MTLQKHVAAAMAKTRAELINAPLARVWPQLAASALSAIKSYDQRCPFDGQGVDLEPTDPCPVCGMLGTLDAENLCITPSRLAKVDIDIFVKSIVGHDPKTDLEEAVETVTRCMDEIGAMIDSLDDGKVTRPH